VGWNSTADGTSSDFTQQSGVTTFASSAALFAQWSTWIRVIYNANGGSGTAPGDTTHYQPGTLVTLLSKGSLTPPAGSLGFAGWNTAPDGSGFTYSGGQTVTGGFSSNIALYAIWPLGITVTYSGPVPERPLRIRPCTRPQAALP
jgi:hypothetical protein